MVARIPAEVFPPGEFIKDELEARGWSQGDLAEILGRPPRVVSEVISGKRAITPETARGLGEAFGTGAQFWMNLETTHQLARMPQYDDTVARRAKIYELAPLKDMIRRNWIVPSDSIDVLEERIKEFFYPPSLGYAPRKSGPSQNLTPAQKTWLYRARQLARAIDVAQFSESSLKKGIASLRSILHSAEEARHVPHLLAESGIRFVVIEPLPKSRIDGVCFWLDRKSPVIALSFRFDRIDWFWFTLMHEIGHVTNRDGLRRIEIDIDLVGQSAVPTEEKTDTERKADLFAADFLVDSSKLEHFISRHKPLYSKKKIRGFAALHHVHPGVVVGQLQQRKEISYAHNREMLVKVRDIVTDSALTDGWGHIVSANL